MNVSQHLDVILGGLAAALATVFGVSKVRRSTAEDNKEVAMDDATAEVVKLLRAELERTTKINEQLQATVLKLHTEIGELKAEVARLRIQHVQQASTSTD